MNDAQRIRQANIYSSFEKNGETSKGLLEKTFVPKANEQGRYYGSGSQHSMYENLPTPIPKDVGGVAYVSPIDAIKFMFAHGIPIDNIMVGEGISNPTRAHVVHVEDTDKM
jgi:hypothetical protein